MKKFKLLSFSIILLVVLAFLSFEKYDSSITSQVVQSDPDTTEWIVPDSVHAFVNPIEVNEELLIEAKAEYRKHCRSCHGRLGDGKGTGAVDVSTEVTDFTNQEFHTQSDGSMFWKISEGRNDMEAFKKKLSEEEIWLTVIYIKTFAPKD